MFGNLKNLHDLQSKAREIQKQLDDEIIETEKNGIKIIMNGKQEVLSVEINSELEKEDQEKYLREAFNDAVKKVQGLMAKKMMGM
jgi:DNA-binding protein YbaB